MSIRRSTPALPTPTRRLPKYLHVFDPQILIAPMLSSHEIIWFAIRYGKHTSRNQQGEQTKGVGRSPPKCLQPHPSRWLIPTNCLPHKPRVPGPVLPQHKYPSFRGAQSSTRLPFGRINHIAPRGCRDKYRSPDITRLRQERTRKGTMPLVMIAWPTYCKALSRRSSPGLVPQSHLSKFISEIPHPNLGSPIQ